jgi:chromosome segregation ATPase
MTVIGLAPVALAVALLPVAEGQTARTGGGAAAQIQLQLQQLSAERANLQAENDKLKKDLAALETERDALRQAHEAVERRVSGATASVTHTIEAGTLAAQELAAIKSRTDETVERYRTAQQSIRRLEAETAVTRQTLIAEEREVATCVDRDLALYRLDEDILKELGAESGWTRLERLEPFTGIARVRHENRVDEERAKAEALRYHAPAAAARAP